jgi:hypothetical protein
VIPAGSVNVVNVGIRFNKITGIGSIGAVIQFGERIICLMFAFANGFAGVGTAVIPRGSVTVVNVEAPLKMFGIVSRPSDKITCERFVFWNGLVVVVVRFGGSVIVVIVDMFCNGAERLIT